LLLGILVFVLMLLPWLLRALAVSSLIAGIWLTWNAIQSVFSAVTETIPLLALQAVPLLLCLGTLLSLLVHKKQRYLWGTMTLLGLLNFLGSRIALKMLEMNDTQALLLSPIALIIILLLFTTLRGRTLRRKEAGWHPVP